MDCLVVFLGDHPGPPWLSVHFLGDLDQGRSLGPPPPLTLICRTSPMKLPLESRLEQVADFALTRGSAPFPG